MKKLFILLFISSLCLSAYSQVVDMADVEKKAAAISQAAADTAEIKKWTFKGMAGINLSQASFTNWSGGGENSVATNAYCVGGAYYRKNRSAWDNDVSLGYGVLYTGENGWRKSSDQIDFSSRYGYAATEKLFYSALASFNTQFAKGFNYPNDSIYISKFMAPGYAIASIGIDYRPINSLSIFASPLTGRFTFVMDDSLSHVGAFGVDEDKKFKAQIGAYTRIAYNANVMTNVNVNSRLELFTAYDKSFGNIVVNWEVMVGMKINKYLTATLNTILRYDDNIKFVDKNGETHGPRVQFKQLLGVGLAYQF